MSEILELLRENNKMLKEIIAYINYINAGALKENDDDFMRNVAANMISNAMENVMFRGNSRV